MLTSLFLIDVLWSGPTQGLLLNTYAKTKSNGQGCWLCAARSCLSVQEAVAMPWDQPPMGSSTGRR